MNKQDLSLNTPRLTQSWFRFSTESLTGASQVLQPVSFDKLTGAILDNTPPLLKPVGIAPAKQTLGLIQFNRPLGVLNFFPFIKSKYFGAVSHC